MELKELIEKIIKQSKKINAQNELGVVETIWADIEDWPAWYYGLFEGERKYDFSLKKPTSIQKLNIATLKKAVVPIVEDYVEELLKFRNKIVVIDDVSTALAERITYWEDWYWDLNDAWTVEADSEEQQAYEEAYLSEYGAGMDERYHGTE